jgi:hypothetical protein
MNPKRTTAGRLSLSLLVFRSSSVEDLEEVCCPLTHSSVNICLGRLDVVMKIVTEGLDVRDIFVASLRSQVSREKDYELSVKARDIGNEICLPKVT